MGGNYCHAWLCVFIHNPESIRRILRTCLKKEIIVLELAMLNSLMKKTAADKNFKGTNLTLHG